METKKKLYYGWVVTVAGFFITGIIVYAGVQTFALFVTPVTKAMEISATAFLLCATFSNIGGIIYCPIVGRMIDEKGIRRTITAGSIVMLLGFIILSFAKTLTFFYIGYFLVGMTANSNIPIVNAISSRWFVKNRGLVNGILNSGLGIYSMFLSPLIASIIATSGHNKAYVLIAGLVAVFALVLNLIFMRDDPRDMGLLPDGVQEETKDESNTGESDLPGLTLKEASKTRSFWFIGIAYTIFLFASGTMMRTWNASFQSIGYDAMTAAYAVSVYGIVNIASKLIWGILSDKLPKNIYCIAGFGIYTVAAVLAGLAKTVSVSYIMTFAVVFSVGNSFWHQLNVKLIVDSFGVKSIGSISGIFIMAMNIGIVLGPLFAGRVFDTTGSYGPAYLIFAGIGVVSAILCMLTKNEYLPESR